MIMWVNAQGSNKGNNGVAAGTATLGLRRERSMSSQSASSVSFMDMKRRSSAVEGAKDESEEEVKEVRPLVLSLLFYGTGKLLEAP